MEGLCPCGHEPAGSIVPMSELVSYWSENFIRSIVYIFPGQRMILIHHAFGETLRVNSWEPSGEEFSLF